MPNSEEVTFQFLKQAEFVHNGARVLFREGQIKGSGFVVSLDPDALPPARKRKPSK